jgi:hypothetical protein
MDVRQQYAKMLMHPQPAAALTEADRYWRDGGDQGQENINSAPDTIGWRRSLLGHFPQSTNIEDRRVGADTPWHYDWGKDSLPDNTPLPLPPLNMQKDAGVFDIGNTPNVIMPWIPLPKSRPISATPQPPMNIVPQAARW